MATHQVVLTVSDEALANFKLVIENNTGLKVLDPLALLKIEMQGDCDTDSLESYAYMVSESDVFVDDASDPKYKGVLKVPKSMR
jgi:hypothetical protein